MNQEIVGMCQLLRLKAPSQTSHYNDPHEQIGKQPRESLFLGISSGKKRISQMSLAPPSPWCCFHPSAIWAYLFSSLVTRTYTAPCVTKLPGGNERERIESGNSSSKSGLYVHQKHWMGFCSPSIWDVQWQRLCGQKMLGPARACSLGGE